MSKRDRLDDPFVAAGNRAYLIGAQSGDFPSMGWHSPGEMGGVWAHPIKLANGFRLAVDGAWLPSASQFEADPVAPSLRYELPGGLTVTRRQLAPDGEPAIIVSFSFSSPTARSVAIRLVVRMHLQGAWPGREQSQVEARFDEGMGAWECRAREQPWGAVVGAVNLPPTAWRAAFELDAPGHHANGALPLALEWRLELQPGCEERIDLVIAGSHTGPADATTVFRRVAGRLEAGLAAKVTRYDAMLGCSRLSLPNEALVRTWEWTNCAYDWLVREVPGVGRGIGGGLAYYPWWFGTDAAYSLLGAVALGRFQDCIDTVDLLRRASERANGDTGRVIHECSTSGVVYHRGNVQESPHLLSTILQLFLWTGDLDFLRRSYHFCRRGLLEWTLGACCPDGDLLPTGCGITERPGMDLKCLDSAVWSAVALDALAEMAGVMGDEETQRRCRELSPRLRARIEQAFWLEDEGMYGDMVATPRDMIPRVTAWLQSEDNIYYSAADEAVRAPLTRLLRAAEADPEPNRERAWLLGYAIELTPVEAGIVPPERAARVLRRMESGEYSGPWGLSVSSVYGQQAMSISTGSMAVAQARYDRPDHAIRSIDALTAALDVRTPGAISEILPDAGCFVQAWSGYGVVWPVVAHMFGVQPDAHRRRLRLAPRFPSAWKEAHLTDLQIGDARVDLHWDGSRLAVEASDPSWQVEVETPRLVEGVSTGAGRRD